jgi:hypothetical protein
MAVTSHVYPLSLKDIFNKTIDMDSDTFVAVLFTGDASAWTGTQEAFHFLTDLKTAYTEVTDSDYGRITVAGLSLSTSGNKLVWTCTSPISWGSSVTITARSMAIVDTTVGGGDSSHPVLAVVDFGQNYVSTSGPWEYDVDGTNGLAAATLS